MAWYTYQINPIDWGWEHSKTVQQTLVDLTADFAHDDHTSSTILDFISDWEYAKVAAKDAGWEGDFSEGPVVIWLPDELNFSYGFVFKQTNNGTTYVVSPVPMPWLDRLT